VKRRLGQLLEAAAEAREEGFESSDQGSREEIRLAEERINAIARQCAGMLTSELFMRGSLPAVLVRVEEAQGTREAADDEPEPGIMIAGVRHACGSLVFAEPAAERIQFRLDDKVHFLRFDMRSNQWVSKSCPTALARRIIGAAAELGFRPCAGIVTVPLFIRGRIVTEQGYHSPTGLVLDCQSDLPSIPNRPTQQQARRAAIVMLRPFRGYLGGLPNGQRKKLRASILTAVLTAVLRPSLPAAPAILFDANQPGAGKGKMARAIATISTGRYPAIITEGHSEEETEKRLAAAILSGASSLLLDNLQRTLASSTLESGLTEGVATIRPFGKLTDTTVPCSALVLITANNAALRADMLRRTLPVRIVVNTETPELRRFDFDPYAKAKKQRFAIIAAALTVAKAWWQARDTDEGCRIRQTTLGSFEAWAELVAGAVEFLTGINPVSLIEERKAEDPRRGDERGLVAAMFAAFGSAEWKAGDAAEKLAAQVWAGVVRFKGEKPSGREIGGWLRSRRDRVFGPYALRCSTDTAKNVTLWWIECLDRRDMRDIRDIAPFAAREVAGDSFNSAVGACPGMSRMSRRAPADCSSDGPENFDGCSDQPDDEPATSPFAGLPPSMQRHLERVSRETVRVDKPATVFSFSPLVGQRGGVKASKAQLASLYDGPDRAYSDDSRAIQLKIEKRERGRRPEYYDLGSSWPCWLVAVEGHASPDDFPTDPHAFNEWFDRWARETGARIICDYREKAEADGGLDYMKPPAAIAVEPEGEDVW
jgi:putative DNA primase/helicase